MTPAETAKYLFDRLITAGLITEAPALYRNQEVE